MVTFKAGRGKFAGYKVGDDGSVWSKKRGGVWKELKGTVIRKKPGVSYKVVNIGGNNVLIHRLVLEAFVGPCPEGMEACHGEGGCLDNSLGNLRWDSRMNNLIDRIKQGTTKLNQEKVRLIRTALGRKEPLKNIAAEHGVSTRTVREVRDGRTWGWLV